MNSGAVRPVFSYSAFGFNFLSDRELSDLWTGNYGSPVHLSMGNLPVLSTDSPVRIASFQFSCPAVADYRAVGGNELFVDSATGADWQSVCLFLFTTGVAALLHQKLVPSLHASAVVTPRGAIVLAGTSASGKSFVAASFMKRGYPILSDDIAAFDIGNQISVLPGLTSLALWKDSLRSLGVDVSSFSPVRTGLQKYRVPLGSSYSSSAVPVRKIYILEVSNISAPRIVPITGLRKLNFLTEQVYRPGILLDLQQEGLLYPLIASIAARVEIARVVRPNGADAGNELVHLIERDLA